MKKFLRFVLVLAVVVAVGAAAAAAIIVSLNKPPENMPYETVFRVEKGENASIIGRKLEEQGLIKSSEFFIVYVKLKNTASIMKSGLYRVKGGSSCFEIHNLLLYGAEELFKVAIPPGRTTRSISQILEEAEIVDAGEFLAEVEKQGADGMLFPDTYRFPKDYPSEKVVSYMVETFENAATSVYPAISDLPAEELKKKIIMASIIEREYRNAEEAARMASVFYNRIDENMYLGSCATIVYVITEEIGREHPERLLYRDLDIESKYNTYRNKGLPPGPICNPGLTAIDAAFNPENTDFLYFLLEDAEKGTHTFSRSLAEHNRSYELYIKGK